MPSGVPIRLVQENGNKIELEATTMTLTTSRKVGGSPIPFTGSKRIGIDLNVNSAMINIQGIIPDDREGTTSTAHSGTIDFGNTQGMLFVDDDFLATGNIEKIVNRRIKLQQFDKSESIKYVTFTEASSGDTRYDASGPNVLVNFDTVTAAELATATAAYINGQHSATHTAVVQSGVDWDGVTGNNVVKISFTTQGADVQSYTGELFRLNPYRTPAWVHTSTSLSYFFDEPVTTKFVGGKTGGKKSAGDKAMDLYGVINNSKRRGRISDWITRDSREDEVKDYIVGIQIPYNSTVMAESGELYVAKNFFMPTGWRTGLQKTSDGNFHPASTDMDLVDETQGIQGSVQKFDIMYDAGETVYTFNLIFAPIDNLIIA